MGAIDTNTGAWKKKLEKILYYFCKIASLGLERTLVRSSVFFEERSLEVRSSVFRRIILEFSSVIDWKVCRFNVRLWNMNLEFEQFKVRNFQVHYKPIFVCMIGLAKASISK